MKLMKTNSRKELPKVSKQFPQEFSQLKEKPAQINRTCQFKEINQQFDNESTKHYYNGSLNKLNMYSSFGKHQIHNMKIDNSKGKSLNNSNSMNNLSKYHQYLKYDNNKLYSDQFNQILSNQSDSLQNFSQIQKVQLTSLENLKEIKISQNFNYTDQSNNSTLNDFLSSPKNIQMLYVNQKIKDDENDIVQPYKQQGYIHQQQSALNVNQKQQNQNEEDEKSNENKKQFNESKRSQSFNTNIYQYPILSKSTSSSKGTEINNIKRIKVKTQEQKATIDGLSDVYLINSSLIQNNQSIQNIYDNPKLKSVSFNIQNSHDTNRICQTKENDQSEFFWRVSMPYSQKVFNYMEKPNNNLIQKDFIKYYPIKEYSNSAYIQIDQQNNQIDSLLQMPQIQSNSTPYQMNKDQQLASMLFSNIIDQQINDKFLQQYENNIFKSASSHNILNQNYLPINSIQRTSLNKQKDFELPRIISPYQKCQSETSISKICNIFNKDQQNFDQKSTKINSINKDFNSSSLQKQNSPQKILEYGFDQIKQPACKQRNIKTPNFNGRMSIKNINSKNKQMEGDEQQILNRLNNYPQQQQLQMDIKQKINIDDISNDSQNQITDNNISTQENTPLQQAGQPTQIGSFQFKDGMNEKQIDLNLSFGNYQNNNLKDELNYHNQNRNERLLQKNENKVQQQIKILQQQNITALKDKKIDNNIISFPSFSEQFEDNSNQEKQVFKKKLKQKEEKNSLNDYETHIQKEKDEEFSTTSSFSQEEKNNLQLSSRLRRQDTSENNQLKQKQSLIKKQMQKQKQYKQ